jgi:hypothetical protein
MTGGFGALRSGLPVKNVSCSKAKNLMKMILLHAMVLGWGILSHPLGAQSGPADFPLVGDWQGVLWDEGKVNHVILHMNITPAGKMTVLMDNSDLGISGAPAIGGSFDGSYLVLQFPYWVPDGKGDLVEKASSYEATVSSSGAEMTGTWKEERSWQLTFKRLTWQAKNPKPAPPTIFDGDWTGIEYEREGVKIHFILHISNTEDGLMALLDCPDEKFEGALASKVSFDQKSRKISITFSRTVFAGKMTANGKALDTSMTEPGYHFWIHFDRMAGKKTEPNAQDLPSKDQTASKP